MKEYSQAFEQEIAVEGLVQNIGNKLLKIVNTITTLIQRAISFLIKFIHKNISQNTNSASQQQTHHSTMTAPQNSMNEPRVKNSASQRQTTHSSKTAASRVNNFEQHRQDVQSSNTSMQPYIDVYDCSKELNDIVSDVQFCIELLAKRPTPNHKLGKGYAEKWNGDNELISDRMERCMGEIDKLNAIDKKTISVETGETLKNRLETLNTQYEKYARTYQMFVKRNAHAEQYLLTTMVSFNNISDVASKALNIILKLYSPVQ